MEASTPSFAWIKVLAIRLLSWLPNFVFGKWIYPDSELRRHIAMFPRADGVQILKVNGNYRAMVHLLVVNLSPYLDLCLEPLKVTIDAAIDCTSKSYVVSRSTVETVNLQGELTPIGWTVSGLR